MDSKKKRNLKSPTILPPRKDPIPNQDITKIITQQDPNLPPHLSKGPTGCKTFIDDTHFSNITENEHTDTTDNSRTYNHICKLLGNHPLPTVVMVIYHYVDRIKRIIIISDFCMKYTIMKNIIQVNQLI